MTKLTLAAMAVATLALQALPASAQGWSGSSYTLGNNTYTTYQGPNGQTLRCSSYNLGNNTYTNCQ